MRIQLARTTASRRPARNWRWMRTSDWPGITVAVAVPALLVAGLLAPVHSATPQRRALAAEHAPIWTGTAPVHDFATAGPTSTPPVLTAVRRPNAGQTAKSHAAARHQVQVSALAADGIPRTALDAYENAAKRADATAPSCKLPWPLLAGIGRVESDHGRFAGAVLYADGTSSTKIIGIRLDGSRSAVIRDTDHGRLDGDKEFDRAVGPMQFIPSTWASYGADGNGDGRKDPFNIFDAALAAANYLCAAGGDLSTLAGQTRAVLAYNHSSAYLGEVLALEKAYAAGVGVVVPVGPNPPRTSTEPPPHLPPVNPGPPPQKPPHHRRPVPHPSGTPSGAPTLAAATPTPSSSATPSPTPTSSSSCATPSPSPSASTSPGTSSGSPASTSSGSSTSASAGASSSSASPSPSPSPSC